MQNCNKKDGHPGRSKKSEKGQKVCKKHQKIVEIPKDTDRDPRRAENCQKNTILCHLTQENASEDPEERSIISKVTPKTLKTAKEH